MYNKPEKAMKNLAILLFAALVFAVSGCNDNTINSRWKTSDIKIDGNKTDWGNSLTLDNNSNFLYGVQNDDKNLYICFATNDPDLEAKIVRMGLTVWLDRNGNDDKVFGINYPLSFQDVNFRNMNFRRDEAPENQMRTRGEDNAPLGADMLKRALERKQNDLEIVGKNKDDVTRMSMAELKGIEIKMAFQDNTLVYELKIPLKFGPGITYALNADTSKPISIGLETGSIDLSKLPKTKSRGDNGGGFGVDNSGSDEPGGDMSAGGDQGEGGYGGGGRQRMRMNPDNMPSPFSYWAEVKLASGK